MQKYKKMVIILIGLMVIGLFPLVKADTFSEWSNHKTLTFLSGYEGLQVNFNITYGIADNGLSFNCKENFEDLRFVDSLSGDLLYAYNQTTEIEDYVNVWLKLGISQEVILYYGNPEAESIWSLDVFEDVIDNCVLALYMNEGDGSICYDYTPYKNNAIIYGATWIETDSLFGNCLSFDGIDDYVLLPNSEQLHINQTFSMAIFVNITGIGSIQYIGGKRTSVDSFYIVRFDWNYYKTTNGEFRYDGSDTYFDVNPRPTILNYKWELCTFEKDYSYTHAFVSGVYGGNISIIGDLTNTNDYIFGKQAGGSYPLSGFMNGIYMFNDTLTLNENYNMYNYFSDATIIDYSICCRNYVYEMPTVIFGTEITSQFEQVIGLIFIILIVVVCLILLVLMEKREDKGK